MLAIASSYLLDALLLAGFAASATIPASIPGWYLASGLGECLLYLLLQRRLAPVLRLSDDQSIVLRVCLCIALQLGFAVLAPQIGFYFLMVLLIVLGLAAMIVSSFQAALIVGAVAIVAGAWFLTPLGYQPERALIPHRTDGERMLVWAGLLLVLARCMLIGTFSGSLRRRLHRRDTELRQSVAVLKARDESFERMNAELHHQANHDALTGLANRALFGERLREAATRQQPFAVVVLDLDRFKMINDSLGHSAGDLLLKQVAERLLRGRRASDTVARPGGDEFMILLADVEASEAIEDLMARWMAILSEPYEVRDMQLHVSPSIGVARYPVDTTDCQELLAFADEAMYHAKQSGRSAVRLYDPKTVGIARQRLTLETELRHALAAGEFELLYQPKADVSTGEVRSVEAVLRWMHPSRGPLAQSVFWFIAEESGLSHAIGVWTLDTACRQAKRWELQGSACVRVGINVSPMQFRHPQFARLVHETLARHALDPARLEVEVDETALMGDAERSQSTLAQLSRLGVVVAIDHFGTGYSNIGYLRRFPIDKLKIDASFVRDLNSNANDASIVHAIISLAHGLRLKVVAQGVETAEQLATLKRMGCDQYQGSLTGDPAPAAGIEALLATGSPTTATATLLDRTISKLTRLVQPRYWLAGPSTR
jgi:diguanylate cyclase (GGDEF)-like protein